MGLDSLKDLRLNENQNKLKQKGLSHCTDPTLEWLKFNFLVNNQFRWTSLIFSVFYVVNPF